MEVIRRALANSRTFMSSDVLGLWSYLYVATRLGLTTFYTERFEAHLSKKKEDSSQRLFDGNCPFRHFQFSDASEAIAASSVVSCPGDVPVVAGEFMVCVPGVASSGKMDASGAGRQGSKEMGISLASLLRKREWPVIYREYREN